jgi:UDP-N-acetylmuramate dehydrogenase
MGTEVDALVRERRIRVLRDEPIGPHTTFRIGGPARYFALPSTVDELLALRLACAEAGVPVRLLGSGANVLAPDEGFPGMVIHLGRMDGVTIDAEGRVEAQAGASFPRLVVRTVQAGLEGFDGLGGIPATVGGALFMNAGGRYGEIFDTVVRVQILDAEGRVRELPRDEIPFGYRRSGLDGSIILGGTFRLRPADPARVRARFEEIVGAKRAAQPMRERCAGCMFKNPPGMSAGRAIEESGLKGTRVGDAVVSPKHANFIVNAGGAGSGDVLALIDRVREGVRARMGVELSLEVLVW